MSAWGARRLRVRGVVGAIVLAAAAAGTGVVVVAVGAESSPPVVRSTAPSTACPATQAAAPAAAALVEVGPAGVRWSVPLPAAAGGSPPVSIPALAPAQPVVADGVAYVSASGRTLAVHTADGSTVWSVSSASDVGATVVDGPLLVLVASRQALALDRRAGGQRWTHPLPAALAETPVLAGRAGLLLVTADGSLTLLDLTSGQTRWSHPGRPGDTAVASGTAVVELGAGGITAYDAGSGNLLWHSALLTTGRPLLTPTVLLTGERPGPALDAIDLRTGRVVWSTPGALVPLVAVHRAVVATGGGQVALLDPGTGRQRWSQPAVLAVATAQATYTGLVLATVESAPGPAGATAEAAGATAGAGAAGATAGAGGRVVGRSAEDGHTVWQSGQPSAGASDTGGTSSGGDLLATVADGRGGGQVTRFDAATGRVGWQAHLSLAPTGIAVPDGANALVLTQASRGC